MEIGRGIRSTGIFFGGLVALVAAAASYTHMQHLAVKHNPENAWLSWLFPLSVDGLVVVASLVIIIAKQAKDDIPKLALWAISIGLGVSGAANIGAGGPDLISKLIALWPSVAFAFAYELVLALALSKTTARKVKVATKKTDKVVKSPSTGAVSPTPAPVEAPKSAVPAPRVEDGAPVPAPVADDSPGAALDNVVGMDGKPTWVTDGMTAREAMFAYLDRHPQASGADLDRFGMRFLGTKKDYGRGVKRAWDNANDSQKASGE